MRDIKFRAYDKYEKEMHIISEINWDILSEEVKMIATGYNDNSCLAYNKNHSSEKCDITALILMQYTGLKDKNGKEIYEGDIVKIKHEFGNTENICEIIYLDGAFRTKKFIFGSYYDCLYYWYANDYELEVIGNIYDNPELLEKGE